MSSIMFAVLFLTTFVIAVYNFLFSPLTVRHLMFQLAACYVIDACRKMSFNVGDFTFWN